MKVNEIVSETATAGSTSAGNVALGAVYPNKKGKTYKNPNGTTKNALDVPGGNLMAGAGGVISRNSKGKTKTNKRNNG